MKTISYLIAAFVVVIAASNAMAGAYDTGEGMGYASATGETVLPSGVIFRVVMIETHARPMLCVKSGLAERSDFSVILSGPARNATHSVAGGAKDLLHTVTTAEIPRYARNDKVNRATLKFLYRKYVFQTGCALPVVK